jgi:peptidoglycan hydrolase-like protein with peptidoglycan-binding domain
VIEKIQKLLRVEPDGIWGPRTQAALNKQIGRTTGINRTLANIQKILGVEDDGRWGKISQAALNNLLHETFPWFEATASSFADPADVVAFDHCKATGKSDQACFRVGDNGVGQFGKITAQERDPMVAIHRDDMVAKWGSVNAAAHRQVRVQVGTKTIYASVEDRLGVTGRIDLNPACAKELGLKPPFLVKCTWSWV